MKHSNPGIIIINLMRLNPILTLLISSACLSAAIYTNWYWNTRTRFPGSLWVGRDECVGKRVYIHNLPESFNKEVLKRACSTGSSVQWMCPSWENHGFGLPARVSNISGTPDSQEFPDEYRSVYSSCRLLPVGTWYRTFQFALELLIHERFKSYRCRTGNAAEADLFYVPYYPGIDLAQYLFTDRIQLRDRLVQRLIGFLDGNRYWNRRGGRDHVLVLGRIVWDFGRPQESLDWGSSLLSIPETTNMFKLLIERDVWVPSQIAVPYPTGFHPNSPQDREKWIQTVEESKRTFHVSFVAALRSGNGTIAKLRRLLREQCEAHSDTCSSFQCEKLSCEWNPELVNCIALQSVFCIMPPGDSPTRKGLFDSILSGCIPVLFSEHTAYTQYLWHLPPHDRRTNSSEYSVFFPEETVINLGMDVIEELERISPKQVSLMQKNIRQLIPRIMYANYSSTDNDPDAFDIILQNLLSRKR